MTPGPDGPDFASIELRPRPHHAPNVGAKPLRKLGFGAVVDMTNAWLGDLYVRERLGEPWAKPVARPGRRGRDDVEYAVWARRYVQALDEAPRSPIKHLIDSAPAKALTAGEIRWYVGEARNRGLLTAAPPGRAGGQLTDKASVLLAQLPSASKAEGKL
jgi:hypothetical protein